jgi:hypothetical protein
MNTPTQTAKYFTFTNANQICAGTQQLTNRNCFTIDDCWLRKTTEGLFQIPCLIFVCVSFGVKALISAFTPYQNQSRDNRKPLQISSAYVQTNTGWPHQKNLAKHLNFNKTINPKVRTSPSSGHKALSDSWGLFRLAARKDCQMHLPSNYSGGSLSFAAK